MRRDAGLFAGLLAILWSGSALVAPSSAVAQSGDGFLFERPRVSIVLRTGYDARRAESDLFDSTRMQYSVGQRDFDAAHFGGEIAVRASDRFDVVLGVGYSRSQVLSEYNDWEGDDDLPINQETSFRTTPVTLSGRYYLTDRGRSIGRFAWVPARVAPYVGGGVGVTWFAFEQDGEFIDFGSGPPYNIYADRLREEGQSFAAHALGGIDFSVTPRLVLNGEARLAAATGTVDGFAYGALADEVDLSGLQVTLGLALRF